MKGELVSVGDESGLAEIAEGLSDHALASQATGVHA